MYGGGGIHGQLLEINVVGCKNLKDKEWLSRQDPYVIVEYASNKFRTKTDTDGGKNPSFNEKFSVPLIEGLREFNVQVWNSNTLSFDDLIGTARVQIERALSSGYDDSSWSLTSKSGKHAGEVKLILHYAHAKQSDKHSKTPPVMPGYPPQQHGGYPPAPPGAGYPPPQQYGYPPAPGAPHAQGSYGYPPAPAPAGGHGYPPPQGSYGGYPPAPPPAHAPGGYDYGHGGSSSKPAAVPYSSPAPPHAPIPAGYPTAHAPQKHGAVGAYGHAPAVGHGYPHVPAMAHGAGHYSHGKHGQYGHGKHKHKKHKHSGWKGFKKAFK